MALTNKEYNAIQYFMVIVTQINCYITVSYRNLSITGIRRNKYIDYNTFFE